MDLVEELRYTPPDAGGITPRLVLAMKRIGVELVSYVTADKLSGQVLNVVTGTLRRSIGSRVTEDGTTIALAVGTNVAYARRFELGFTGSETVRAHLRTIHMAWGRSIAAKTITVNTFTRRVHQPERSFLRTSLEERRGQILRQLEEAVRA